MLAFVVPFVILMLLSITWWLSAVLAALIGLCLSYIFLRSPREAVAENIYRRRHGDPAEFEDAASRDADIEDSLVDSSATPAGQTADDTSTAEAAADERSESQRRPEA